MLINEKKKDIQARVLTAARRAGVPIPTGETHGMEPAPDFIFQSNRLGIELTELLRPAENKGGFVPAAEDAFHKEVVQMAREQYYRAPDAGTARVVVYFSRRGRKKDKRQLADALCNFVKENVHRANPVAGFSSPDVPDGIGAMSITSDGRNWWSGECGGATLSEIRMELANRIIEKNKRVKQYRKNLPPGSSMWLLIYSGVAVSRYMPIPHGIGDWAFPSEFDHIFWLDLLGCRVIEIRRTSAE